MNLTKKNSVLIISCEHGGNDIPKAYRHLFLHQQKVLASHRGYDIGALALAKVFAPITHYTQYSCISRLLVELNRSVHHPKLFSKFTKALDDDTKASILDKHYFPYRDQLQTHIANAIDSGKRVIHISVHSFTPVLSDKIRNAEIGFLYDSARKQEKAFCVKWHAHLKATAPDLRVRYNYPYLGKSDGLTSYLRKQFSHSDYLGIELETNQALWQQTKAQQGLLQKLLFTTLQQTL